MIRRIPFHPFLLALFPLLFIIVGNHRMLGGNVVVPLLVILAGVAVVFGVVWGLTRDVHVAGAVTSLAALMLLWYGPARAVIEGLVGPSFRHRHTLLLVLAVLAVAAVLLLRRPAAARAITGPMNLFCSILLAMLVVQLGAAEWNRARAISLVSRDFASAGEWESEVVGDTIPRRSIYYIIVDGYARDDVLRDVFSFDNSAFTDALRRRGFQVNPESRSNYSLTLLSLASSLNGAHLNHLPAAGITGKRAGDRMIPFRLIQQNRVMRFLGGQGYTVVNLASGWGGTEALPLADENIRCGPSEFMETLLRQTAAWPLVAERFKEDVYALRLCQLRALAETSGQPGPKFVLAHLLLPHPPYVFAADGERLPGELTALGADEPWRHRDLYLGQLRFLNQALLPVLDTLIAREAPAPIIVLQSDHGPSSTTVDGRDLSNVRFVRERMSILNALLLPGADDQAGRRFLTPVNTFPLLVNEYFGIDWPRSPDASYISPRGPTFEFTRVDSILVDR